VRTSLQRYYQASPFLLLLLAPILLLNPRSLAEPVPPARANYDLALRFTANGMRAMVQDRTVRPVWLDGGERFFYVLRQGSALRFIMVDAEEKTKTELSLDRTPVSPTVFEFTIEGRDYSYDTITQEVERLAPDRALYEAWETPSPDRRLVAFVRNHDLVIQKAGEKTEERVIEGEPYCSFAESEDPFYAGEAERTDTLRIPVASWSPDSRKLVASRKDIRHFRDRWVLDSTGGLGPRLITYKQRFPGDPPPPQEVWLYNADADTAIQVDADRWKPSAYEQIVWTRNSREFFMVRKSPDRLMADLLLVDAQTGVVEVLVEERTGAYALTRPAVEIGRGEGFLWWSRRSGWGHYYRYDMEGRPVTEVTSGEFTAGDILGIDRQEGWAYLMASGVKRGSNPYLDRFYRAPLRGGELRPLTFEDGHHEIYLSPDKQVFVDNRSLVDIPGRAVLRNIEGVPLLDLEAEDISPLTGGGWKAPEVVRVRAADGKTDLWGVMWKPYDFDPARRYPVIARVYPGPQSELIPFTFREALNNNAHLAQYGFIVIHCGVRGGSFKRSLEYSEHYRGNLRDYPVADIRAAIENLARGREYMDLQRVGLWGGSSGGFAALTAMLTFPDFFRACAARSGPHDPSIYHAWWSDHFQGMTREAKAERDTAWVTRTPRGNLSLARNLDGRLLLLHSAIDTNVHPAHSARMARALMAAGKDFDYFVVPGAGHEWGPNWRYTQQLIWDFFVQNLLEDGP
jgi:dipeptidyl aminopeptidase/acylaminoacyl peptidase